MKEFEFSEKDNIASVKLGDMVEVLPHRALRSITKYLCRIWNFIDIFTDAMQTTFQILPFYCA